MIIIDEIQLSLLQVPGFIERYRFWCATGCTYTKAYEKTEEEFEAAFRFRKFSSYSSFRTTLYKYNKKYLKTKNK